MAKAKKKKLTKKTKTSTPSKKGGSKKKANKPKKKTKIERAAAGVPKLPEQDSMLTPKEEFADQFDNDLAAEGYETEDTEENDGDNEPACY
jgi:hypothetical protein